MIQRYNPVSLQLQSLGSFHYGSLWGPRGICASSIPLSHSSSAARAQVSILKPLGLTECSFPLTFFGDLPSSTSYSTSAPEKGNLMLPNVDLVPWLQFWNFNQLFLLNLSPKVLASPLGKYLSWQLIPVFKHFCPLPPIIYQSVHTFFGSLETFSSHSVKESDFSKSCSPASLILKQDGFQLLCLWSSQQLSKQTQYMLQSQCQFEFLTDQLMFTSFYFNIRWIICSLIKNGYHLAPKRCNLGLLTQGLGRLGHLRGSAVERLPSAQGMIPGSWNRVPHGALCGKPATPSVYVSAPLSLSLSLMNK